MTQKAVADFFGVKPPTVSRWVQRRWIPDPSNIDDIGVIARALYRRLSEAAAGREAAEGTQDERLQAIAERARLDCAKANIAELEFATKSSQVINKATTLRQWGNSYRFVVTKLEAIPNRAALLVCGEDNPQEIRTVLESLIRDALEELISADFKEMFGEDNLRAAFRTAG